MSQSAQSSKIAALNDAFRSTFIGGSVMLTSGVQSLLGEVKKEILHGIQNFDDFTPGNDPYEEHDFGSLTVQGHRVFFKIDYYDLGMEYHSQNPANPSVTNRVLTVMLAGEY